MLYTGKGDAGTTQTFGCDQTRISKSSELPEALGALDELNAFLGFVKTRAAHELRFSAGRVPEVERIANVVREAQEKLFIIQAEVAGADKHIRQIDVASMETIISEIEQEIPPITSFSVAGGTEVSALLDVARTLARKAERRIVAAADAGVREVAPETRAYMNRLSSLLFALARLSNHLAGVADESPKY